MHWRASTPNSTPLLMSLVPEQAPHANPVSRTMSTSSQNGGGFASRWRTCRHVNVIVLVICLAASTHHTNSAVAEVASNLCGSGSKDSPCWLCFPAAARNMHVFAKKRRLAGAGKCAVAPQFEAVVERVFSFLSKPMTSPGPSDMLIARERRARALLKAAEARAASSEFQDTWAGVTAVEKAKAEVIAVEKVLSVAYADLESYPVPEYLNEYFGQGVVNMAVTGSSGVGKSSWINAVRKIGAKDPDAAKTGVVETTDRPRAFTFEPGRSNIFRKTFDKLGRFLHLTSDADSIHLGDRVILQDVPAEYKGKRAEVTSIGLLGTLRVRLDTGKTLQVSREGVTGRLAACMLWDLPGVGTEKFPQSSYLKSMGIRHFDLVVLITATRFTEAELMLMDELRRWKVPFFLVRSKIDIDVEACFDNEEVDCSIGDSDPECRKIEEDTIATVRFFFAREYNERAYCVSSKRKLRRYFDFDELEQSIASIVRSQRVVREQELKQDSL
eukprot:TRINITY_DN74716_c0_g1_i1.p1 TRINITY_DN74716_c0_g1~~TRINITY_DN74716_c0_g1_i1.p1  ORF type:complete len:499 (+),score=69.91 TRINITY_DN74716_c0_g1_i1:141-1637(+)